MPPKKKEAEVAQEAAIIEDPAVAAARAERERIHAEEKKLMERNEVIDRRRVEALEQVSWRCVHMEKEKRLDPTGWAAKIANKGPNIVFVKPLAGNRSLSQQVFHIPITDETTFLLLKNAIRDEAVKYGSHPVMYAPEKQKLFHLTKEMIVPDEYNCTLASQGIHGGATVHVALDPPSSFKDLIPSKVK